MLVRELHAGGGYLGQVLHRRLDLGRDASWTPLSFVSQE